MRWLRNGRRSRSVCPEPTHYGNRINAEYYKKDVESNEGTEEEEGRTWSRKVNKAAEKCDEGKRTILTGWTFEARTNALVLNIFLFYFAAAATLL